MTAADGRSDFVLAMAKKGVRPAEIAERCNITAISVYSRLAYYRRRGVDIPRFARGPCPAGEHRLHIARVAPDLRDLLAPHAAKRHLTINELARDLIDTIAREGLVDAILDDAEDLA